MPPPFSIEVSSEAAIPLVDLAPLHAGLREAIDAAVAGVIERGDFIRGTAVEHFERRAAAYLGVRHAVGVASGSDALTLALRAAGIGPGDEVITTAFTFWASVESIYHVGAQPVFADIDPATLCLDPASIEASITPRSRAILAVHIFGHAADMSSISAIAERHGLVVIEDCAQAFGATRRKRKAGSFGLAGCFSFYPSKPLGAMGDGGMIVSDDDAFIDRLRHLCDHGRCGSNLHNDVGYNSRLDSLQAAVLDVKLKHFSEHLAERRRLAKKYIKMLADLPVQVPDADPAACAFGQFTLRCENRDELKDYLAACAIASAVYYPMPVYRQPAIQAHYVDTRLPVTEAACRTVLSLPLYVGLGEGDQRRVGDAVGDFFATRACPERQHGS